MQITIWSWAWLLHISCRNRATSAGSYASSTDGVVPQSSGRHAPPVASFRLFKCSLRPVQVACCCAVAAFDGLRHAAFGLHHPSGPLVCTVTPHSGLDEVRCPGLLVCLALLSRLPDHGLSRPPVDARRRVRRHRFAIPNHGMAHPEFCAAGSGAQRGWTDACMISQRQQPASVGARINPGQHETSTRKLRYLPRPGLIISMTS